METKFIYSTGGSLTTNSLLGTGTSLSIDSLEESEIESENEIFDLFWTWFRVIESGDLESEELTNQIKEAYFKSVDVSKGEHLSVSIAS